jgi:hypothetical protein
MDIDIAINALDQFARNEPVSVHQVCKAANLVSRYVEFLELFSSPKAVSASRKDLRLVSDERPQEGDFLAVVTLDGADYTVSAYNHVLGGIALRLAERELTQKLSLRTIDGQAASFSLHPLTTVISAAMQPQHKTNQSQ